MIIIPLIDRELYKRVEHELYNYHQHVREQNEIRAEILHGTHVPDVNARSEGRISDTTGQKAVRLAEVEGGEQGRWVECVHDAFQLMPQEYKMLIKYKYFDKLHNYAVMQKLRVGKSAYYEWRQSAIMMIVLLATQRGLCKPIKEKKTG